MGNLLVSHFEIAVLSSLQFYQNEPEGGSIPVPDIHDTTYPHLKSSFSDGELYEFYTPFADGLALTSEVAKGVGPKICFLILLKTFRRLGYFVFLQDVPMPIV